MHYMEIIKSSDFTKYLTEEVHQCNDPDETFEQKLSSALITIGIVKSGEQLLSYEQWFNFNRGGAKRDWISPSYYIDSDDENIVLKANELIKGLSASIEKAKAIQQFVINHLELNLYYKNFFLDKASKTYELGYATCVNFSRLYVALCRAANIPARSVYGVVYGFNNDNIYDYHHQWAEILDESGYWHPLDFGYTTIFDLNDIRYLDLIYAAEENTIIMDRDLYDIMLDLHYYNDYPMTWTGGFGFELKSDNRPDSMIVEYSYKY